jgi:cyclopropane fatty-acyl-phospholipid synthase-like methyltransferase/methyltransferase-like protein
MNAELQASYDEFPYLSLAFPQSHPDRLATIARLHRLVPAPVGECRVLEIGCAAGGNLIPMAAALPRSRFLGIDFSAVQVREGLADVAALGLANIELKQVDLRDFGEESGVFDYIIAHGVYSWVPPAVQEKLLDVCARQLAAGGIAYISYNTLPGWNMRGIVRDAMRYHTRQFPDARSRVQQARATLDFLAQATEGARSPYALMLRSEAEQLRRKQDYYVLHDHLEEFNEALFFHQFAARAARHGLAFLAEAEFRMMQIDGLPAPVAHTLNQIAPGILQREQLTDFLRNRNFRQTLLVHEDAPVDRVLTPGRVNSLWVASAARVAGDGNDPSSPAPGEFRMPDGSGLRTPHPISKAAMAVLAKHWPAPIPFSDLAAMAAARIGLAGDVDDVQTATLASDLLKSFCAGAAELHALGPAFVIEPGARPQASPVARLQVTRGPYVTNMRHEMVGLDDADRRLLSLLDGSVERTAIASQAFPGQPPKSASTALDEAMARLARQALLVQ